MRNPFELRSAKQHMSERYFDNVNQVICSMPLKFCTCMEVCVSQRLKQCGICDSCLNSVTISKTSLFPLLPPFKLRHNKGWGKF